MDVLTKHGVLLTAVFFSLLLVFLFIYIKERRPSLLSLETRWLAVSIIPLIVALISGGYIYKFKGFGIEIETSLKKLDVSQFTLKASEVMKLGKSVGKGSISELQQLPDDIKKKTTRLSFINGYNGYTEDAVKIYLHELRNLQVVEIVDESNKFIAMMRVKYLKGKERQFVRSLGNKSILSDFSAYIVTDFIQSESNIIDVLKEIKESKKRALAVVNSQGVMIGLINEINLLRKISYEILKADARYN